MRTSARTRSEPAYRHSAFCTTWDFCGILGNVARTGCLDVFSLAERDKGQPRMMDAAQFGNEKHAKCYRKPAAGQDRGKCHTHWGRVINLGARPVWGLRCIRFGTQTDQGGQPRMMDAAQFGNEKHAKCYRKPAAGQDRGKCHTHWGRGHQSGGEAGLGSPVYSLYNNM